MKQKKKKKIVVLSGAGMSAESGLKTFRDTGGLWEGVDVMEVASIEGWQANAAKMITFYNHRRKQAFTAQPNSGHLALAELEAYFDVQIITQNVDSLHERAGSTKVLHLHGKLSEVKSSVDDKLVYDIGDKEIQLGDLCDKGSQLRPNVVWFGEAVPEMEPAMSMVQQAEVFLIVGTSLVVYPAASLVYDVPRNADITLIDPTAPEHLITDRDINILQKNASTGVPKYVQQLIKDYG